MSVGTFNWKSCAGEKGSTTAKASSTKANVENDMIGHKAKQGFECKR